MNNNYTFIKRGTILTAALSVLSFNTLAACPSSHPYECGGNCYVDAAQAQSGGCNTGGGNSGGDNSGNNGGNNNPPSNGSCHSSNNPSHVVSGRRTDLTQPWCDTVCVTYIANNTACINATGTVVTNASICSDPAHAKESIIDLEHTLGINIDDNFIAQSGYQGSVPPINPQITANDARKYFVALIGEQKGNELVDILDTNKDGMLNRNEASQAKGSDPRQVLNTGFGCGLSTDDILAYIGLYMGDGAIDKYAGDLDAQVKEAMLKITRSWQPGVNAQACKYRGGC